MASSNQPYPYSGNGPGTKPSPPSPSSSSPGLTQSTSNSSGSPPQPSTPPRRQNKRQLDQGRIPLHRRGTSRTYENLEDLLREAGYKETRIYTPESDRIEPHARDEEGDQPSGKTQGVRAAVVGFLTALVTGTGNDTAASPSGQESDEQRPRFFRTQSPSSPLTDRKQVSPYLRENARSVESIEPPFTTSPIESLSGSSSKTRRQQTPLHYQNKIPSQPSTPNSPEEPSYSSTSGNQTCHDLHHTQSMSRFPNHHQHHHHHQNHRHPAARSRIQNQASWPSIITSSNNNVISLDPSYDTGTTTSNNSTILINDPIPSRAGTYLRHVISTPTIVSPPPPNSTPRNQSNSGTEGGSALPRKWLDSVARVLTLGVATTSFGNSTLSNSPTPNTSPSSPVMASPSHPPPPSSFHRHHPHPHYQSHPHHRTLRTSRSSISQTTYQSALSATTTTTRSRLETRDHQTNYGPLTPPVFLTRFERERAPCSQGQVSRARVYCRSAPPSRAPSPNRSSRFSFYYHNNKNKNIINNKKNDLRDHNSNNNNGGGRGGRGLGKRVYYHAQRGGGMIGGRRRNWRRKKGEEDSAKVPSLAKTRVEGDGWHKSSGKGRRQGYAYFDNNDDPFSSNNKNNDHHHRHRHPQQPQQQYFPPRYDDDGENGGEFDEDEEDEEEEEDEEDEEGELDLAKMLVNPKRQQSIRSLRKHLHHSQLLTSPSSAFIDPSKNGLTSSNAPHPDAITNPSLSRLHPHNPSTTTAQHRRRFASGKQSNNDDIAGQWERQWRSGELTSSRRGSEDDDLYESLTWLNDDKDDDSKRKKDSAKELR